jgi:hypothetical protein
MEPALQTGVIYMTVFISAMLSGFAAKAQSPAVFSQSQAELADILRPHVVTLDRDLILFRYEAKDRRKFNPRTQQDLIDREYHWSKRFFNMDIVDNPDGGGPGLYTSTDPVATATWGMTAPGLFALTLKKDSRVLIGEMPQVSKLDKAKLSGIYGRMNCRGTFDQRDSDEFSEVVVRFRNSENRECRRLMIETFTQLEIRAITYSFYSSPLRNCRATGTAVNVVWPDALALVEINYYSDDIVIEGKKSLTPFVNALFDEAKDYFFTQTVLADENVRAKFDNAYGFFAGAEKASDTAYELWKSLHILRCGDKWPTEVPDFRAVTNLNGKANADRELQTLFAKTAVAYNRRGFNHQDAETKGAEAEFSVSRMRRIEDLEYKQLHAGGRLAEESFKELKDKGDNRSLWLMAMLLGEEFVGSYGELNARLVGSLERIDHSLYNHPALFAFMLRGSGFGPRISRFAFNEMQYMSGNVPILEGGLPSDPSQPVTELFERNKKIFSDILKACLEIYSDRRISNKAVYDGPCGVTNSSYR